MNKLFTLMLALAVTLTVAGQQVKQEISENKCLSGSNHLAYPGPSQERLTPAPKGYRPFYISHYGRHGSRYLIGQDEYDVPVKVLARADSMGKLTPLGADVLRRARLLKEEARGKGNKPMLKKIEKILSAFDTKELDKTTAAEAVNKAKAAINKL